MALTRWWCFVHKAYLLLPLVPLRLCRIAITTATIRYGGGLEQSQNSLFDAWALARLVRHFILIKGL